MTNVHALPTSPYDDNFDAADVFDAAAIPGCCDDCGEVTLISADAAQCLPCYLATVEAEWCDEAEGPDDSYDIDADADRAAYYDAADAAGC